jgi:SAM-dependent methyltransferase
MLKVSHFEFESLYRTRFEGAEDYRTEVWRVLSDTFFQRWIEPTASVLDLGAGYCEFINTVAAGEKYAMDLNPETGRRASGAVRVLEQDCSAGWPLKDGDLDVVFTSNFLEHLPDKSGLEMALCEARRCLKPGGRFIALGPNLRFTGGAYWDYFDHHLPLTDRSLVEVLRKTGFRPVTLIPRFLPYTMSGGRRYPLWMLRAYLHLPAAWRWFGKQFLVIAER